MKKILKAAVFFFPAAAIFFLLVGYINIKPVAWKPPTLVGFNHALSFNEKLIQSQKISLGGWYGPEDIILDSLGNVYCGVHKVWYYQKMKVIY